MPLNSGLCYAQVQKYAHFLASGCGYTDVVAHFKKDIEHGIRLETD